MVNFKDEKEFKKLETAAFKGSLDISEFPAAEYRYFDRITKIGQKSREGKLPKDFCVESRNKAYGEYLNDIETLRLQFKAYAGYQDNVIKAKQLTSDVQKAKPEDKLIPALRCIEAMTGEQGFAERAIKYYERAKEK